MWDIRPIAEAESDLFRSRLSRAFGHDADTDDGANERFLELFEIERTFAAFEDGDIIGTGGAFSLDLTVPGGCIVPMAGTTIVSVQPTHRRLGILTAMMGYHLDEVAHRGEPIVGLWASETGIYNRFGFGTATYMYQTKIHTPAITMLTPEPPGRARLIDAEDAGTVLRSVYEKARATTPGMFSRNDSWWALRVLRDPESKRDGKSALRFVVYEEEDRPLGYAIYRQKQKWGEFPEGEIHVGEIVTATPEAHRGIWGYLTNIDLFPSLEWWNSPLDDPLPLHVNESRRIERRLSDALWVRLLDVASALEARSYEHDGELLINIEDRFRPGNSGTYELRVAGGIAKCVKVEGSADLRCSVDVLGHLYLGGGDALALARSGRVVGEEASIIELHRIFRTDRAPWCQEIF